MRERNQVVVALTQEFLGERHGPYEVLNAMMETWGIDSHVILTIQAQRRAERSGFRDRVLLVSVDEGDSCSTTA